MSLVGQWREIERTLPDGWGVARLRLTVSDAANCERTASLLGPIGPGRRASRLSFFAARRGAGPSPDVVERLLRRIDSERIAGELELVGSDEVRPEETQPVVELRSLAATWDAAVGGLPPDWSDIYAELQLVSTDWLERGALLMAPVNPARAAGLPAFRFRVARRSGYGASPEMTRRCLERVDEARIRGTLHILRVLSDTEHVATQGPVWYVGGRAV